MPGRFELRASKTQFWGAWRFKHHIWYLVQALYIWLPGLFFTRTAVTYTGYLVAVDRMPPIGVELVSFTSIVIQEEGINPFRTAVPLWRQTT